MNYAQKGEAMQKVVKVLQGLMVDDMKERLSGEGKKKEPDDEDTKPEGQRGKKNKETKEPEPKEKE